MYFHSRQKRSNIRRTWTGHFSAGHWSHNFLFLHGHRRKWRCWWEAGRLGCQGYHSNILECFGIRFILLCSVCWHLLWTTSHETQRNVKEFFFILCNDSRIYIPLSSWNPWKKLTSPIFCTNTLFMAKISNIALLIHPSILYLTKQMKC